MVDSGYERDYSMDPRANDSLAGEGGFRDGWVLQAMDYGDRGDGLWQVSLNDWTQWLRDGHPVSASLWLLLSLSMMLTS